MLDLTPAPQSARELQILVGGSIDPCIGEVIGKVVEKHFGQQREFFEFKNTFHLDEALDMAIDACGPIPLVDFNRAKSKFMQEHSVEDLLAGRV